MFIGHFAVGFAAKRLAPRSNVGILLLSCSMLDVLWPLFLLIGLEDVRISPGITAVTPLDFVSYPYSHSLLMAVAWAVVFGIGYWCFRRYRLGALAVGLGVVSHWILDFITHRPDLPLSLGQSARVGLGLWNSVEATVLVEATLFLLATWTYARDTEATDAKGSWGFWSFVLFLWVVYAANLAGPPPPSVEAIAYVGLASTVLYVWPYWFDNHRVARRP